MRLKKIYLDNFMSFGQTDIEFNHSIDDEPKIFVIDGLNLDAEGEDNASNGSGKSSLISESIMFNIYGKALRGSKQKLKIDDMIRNGTDKLTNEIEYFINVDKDTTSDLKITRTRELNGKSNTSLSIGEDEKTKRTKRLSDKDIRMFIDIDPDVFSQVIVYYRDNINLLAMNGSQRLEFFRNIVDLTILDDYFAAAKDFKQQNEKAIYQLEVQQKSTKDILDILSEKNKKTSYDEFIKKRISELKSDLAGCSDEIVDLDTTQLETDKKELNSVVLTDTKIVDDATAKIVYNNRAASIIRDEIKKFNSLSGGKCPTCAQIVPQEYTANAISKYQSELDDLLTQIAESNRIKQDTEKVVKDNKKKIEEITDKINDIKNKEIIRQNKISSIQTEINKLTRELDSIKPAEDDDDEDKKSKYEKKYEGLKNALNIRYQWQESGDYWYNMFAPKSLLRGAIMKKYVALLSDMFEYYITALYNNEILGKMQVNDDGQIDIILWKDSYEMGYFNLSSGERKRMDVALLLALYEFISYINENIPKFLVLDEIFDSLDQIGRTSVMQALLDVQQRHHIDLFLISHTDIPLEIIPEDITVKHALVTKINKTSSVKMN